MNTGNLKDAVAVIEGQLSCIKEVLEVDTNLDHSLSLVEESLRIIQIAVIRANRP